MVSQIYPSELQLNKANTSDTETTFLDLHLSISNDIVSTKRGTFICAHAWIFFKLCILITHYIRTMKMYLSNYIVKNKA